MHNMLKVNNDDTRTTLIDIVLVSLMLTLNIFRTFSAHFLMFLLLNLIMDLFVWSLLEQI